MRYWLIYNQSKLLYVCNASFFKCTLSVVSVVLTIFEIVTMKAVLKSNAFGLMISIEKEFGIYSNFITKKHGISLAMICNFLYYLT